MLHVDPSSPNPAESPLEPLPAAPGSATWEWDLATGTARFSSAVGELLGIGRGPLEPAWSDFRARILPADAPGVEAAVRSALEHGQRWSVRYRLVRPSANPVEVQEQGFVVRRDGTPVKALGVLLSTEQSEQVKGVPHLPAELSEEQFHTFIDSLPQLAWTAGPDGWVDFYNRRWYEYTDTTFEQMEGWGWIQVHDPTDLPRMLRIWRNAHATCQPWEDEFRMRRGKDGMLRWHLSRALPYRDATGKVVRWFGTNTDIHDQKLASEEYSRLLAREQLARKQAEAANKAKDEFLAVVSHELRTPLNTISVSAQILRLGDLDESRHTRTLDRIENNVRLQVKLIEDLLDISRIVTGKLAVDFTDVDPSLPVRAAAEACRQAAEAKGTILTCSLETDGARVRGSSTRLHQIATNLITNAVKFTPQGGHIRVTLLRTGATLELSVQDDGEGIAPDFLPHVFERFRQADSSSTRRHGGLGLGLAIVRELVQVHGGEVDARSDGPGRGATFTVRLPLATDLETATSPSDAAPSERSGEMLSLTGIKVLGVDDDPGAREVLAETLLACGATVTLAASVHEALRAFKLDRPDVVVSDIGMPEQDGYALASRIRALPDPAASSTPLIALTAYASLEDRKQALRSGFDRYLSKPLDAAKLSHLISDLARQHATS